MNKNKRTYKLKNKVAAILMILTLLWLTASTPFVYAAQQQWKQTPAKSGDTAKNLPGSEDSSCNPFGNTTEEKSETGSSSLSEYLHHIDELQPLPVIIPARDSRHEYSVYVAFHGELLCPPPNFIHS